MKKLFHIILVLYNLITLIKKVLNSLKPTYNILLQSIKKGEEVMPLDDRKSNIGVIQNIVLENREKLSISGVLDVLSFDDQVVIVETELGLLTIKGDNLRINKLSIDTSEVVVEGEIYNLAYSDSDLDKKQNGLLSKIFK